MTARRADLASLPAPLIADPTLSAEEVARRVPGLRAVAPHVASHGESDGR